VQKDMQKLDLNLRDLCESSLPLLRELCDILPSKKSLKAGGISDEILAGHESFSKLQVAMAEVNTKISNLQEMGYINRNVLVMILHLEDQDAEPLHRTCDIEETFGELIQKAFVSADGEGADEGEGDDECDDDVIPDVWVKKWDTDHNTVTKTGQWWEHQPETLKIREVFATAGSSSSDDTSQKQQWKVEIVAKKGDYVIALVNDNGKELGKAVDLPNKRKGKCTTDHIKTVFANQKVARVLDLQNGKDASQKMFNKLHYRPKTNPLYIELEPISQMHVDSAASGPRAQTV